MSRVKSIGRRGVFAAALMAVTTIFTAPAMSADRVLLIGVGKHQDSRLNLPGIDLDIGIMKDVARLLGFKKNQIKILMNEQSTLANVKKTMKTWLVKGVKPNDRVMIYYSGHGSRVPDDNGDEADGADEVMIMHDVKVVRRNGKMTLLNVFRDDTFNRILKAIPSKNVLVFVDSCHSGSITKSLRLSPQGFGESEGTSKFFYYEGMPSGDASLSSKGAILESKGYSENYISVVAAQDNEQSIATSKGSVFTLGLRKAIRDAVKAQHGITPKQIHRIVTSYVKAKMAPRRPFHPNILGSARLASKSLFVAKLNGYGPTWKRLEKIVTRSAPLRVRQNQSSYKLGDTMTITVDVPQDGYLNVVNVGPDDTATVLFPNKYHRNNRVSAGKLRIPTSRMNFDITAQAPTGKTMTVAIITSKPVDLYRSSLAQRNSKGDITDIFGELSEYSMHELENRNFGVTKRQNGKQKKVLAGKIISEVHH